VADGAARQAAALLLGEFPDWSAGSARTVPCEPTPEVLSRYRAAATLPLLGRPAVGDGPRGRPEAPSA
jgi:hypothetical protein